MKKHEDTKFLVEVVQTYPNKKQAMNIHENPERQESERQSSRPERTNLYPLSLADIVGILPVHPERSSELNFSADPPVPHRFRTHRIPNLVGVTCHFCGGVHLAVG